MSSPLALVGVFTNKHKKDPRFVGENTNKGTSEMIFTFQDNYFTMVCPLPLIAIGAIGKTKKSDINCIEEMKHLFLLVAHSQGSCLHEPSLRLMSVRRSARASRTENKVRGDKIYDRKSNTNYMWK